VSRRGSPCSGPQGSERAGLLVSSCPVAELPAQLGAELQVLVGQLPLLVPLQGARWHAAAVRVAAPGSLVRVQVRHDAAAAAAVVVVVVVVPPRRPGGPHRHAAGQRRRHCLGPAVHHAVADRPRHGRVGLHLPALVAEVAPLLSRRSRMQPQRAEGLLVLVVEVLVLAAVVEAHFAG